MGVCVSRDVVRIGESRSLAEASWRRLPEPAREEIYRISYAYCAQQRDRPTLQRVCLAFPFSIFRARISTIITNFFYPALVAQPREVEAGDAAAPGAAVAEPLGEAFPRHLGVVFAHMGMTAADVTLMYDLLLDTIFDVCEAHREVKIASAEGALVEILSSPESKTLTTSSHSHSGGPGAISGSPPPLRGGWGIREQRAWALVIQHDAQLVLESMARCLPTLHFLTSTPTTLCPPAKDSKDRALTARCLWLAEMLFPTVFPPGSFIAQQLCPHSFPISHRCAEIQTTIAAPHTGTKQGATSSPPQSANSASERKILDHMPRYAALRHRYLYFYDADAQGLITIDEPVAALDLSSVDGLDETTELVWEAQNQAVRQVSVYVLAMRLRSGVRHFLYFPTDIQRESWASAISACIAMFTQSAYFDGTGPTRIQRPAATTSTADADNEEMTFVPERDVDFVAVFRNSFPFRARLSDFEFGPLLGAGNFGRVVKCWHKQSKAVFALKIIRKEKFRGVRNVIEARRERRVLETANHPYIMKIHRTFQSKDRVYLLLDYLPGGELLRHTQQAPEHCFPEAFCRFYIAELACALEYLRQQGIMHRDIKGDNLVLDEHGHLILTDFGFAKRADPGKKNKTCCGTLAYMAPEMLAGDHGYSYEVDWWSMGVVLFTILTGFFPFLKSRRRDTIEAITLHPLQFPTKPAVGPLAADVCYKLLSKDPSKRLATLADLKRHQWFEGFDWAACEAKALPSPYQVQGFPAAEATDDAAKDEPTLEQELAATALVGHEHAANFPREADIFGSTYDHQERAGSDREGFETDSGDELLDASAADSFAESMSRCSRPMTSRSSLSISSLSVRSRNSRQSRTVRTSVVSKTQ